MRKISVIVAIYNIEKYLKRCIESILAQTYRDYEMILVDDGSTDGSSALCDLYQQKDDRIIVIHKENGGLVSARKAGIAFARGEYVSFVDGDDWMEPQMYENLMRLAAEYRADIVLEGSLEDTGTGKAIRKTNRLKPGIYDKERLQKEMYPYMLCTEEFFSMGIQPYLWNKLIRRTLAEECILAVDNRIRIGEDVAAVMPMIWKADKAVVSDDCHYHYCIRESSMMQKKENEAKAWDELCILHRFLRDIFSVYQSQYRINVQLRYYTIMNMLTRTYGKIAERESETVLWPFHYQLDAGTCIVYGAGNFGRAVWRYLQAHDQIRVSWVDREFRKYHSMGLPVCNVEEIVPEKDADILVAVLDMHSAKRIEEDLLRLGIQKERIYRVTITDQMVCEILGYANLL